MNTAFFPLSLLVLAHPFICVHAYCLYSVVVCGIIGVDI